MKMLLSVLVAVLSFEMGTVAKAQETQLLPVPSRPIYPGESLKETDFTMKLFNVNPVHRTTYIFEPSQILRMEAVRTLGVGKPVLLKSIKTTEDVKKGQPTKALYSSNTIEIQGTLVPLTGGSVGEMIEARNPASSSVVRAMIVEGGTLLVMTK